MRWRLALPYKPSDNPDPGAKNFVVIKALELDIAGDRIFARGFYRQRCMSTILQREFRSLS